MSPGTIDLPASVIDPVVADIARTAGVPVDQVRSSRRSPVTFPDGSLGCPTPGLAYTQVVGRRLRIVAKVGDGRVRLSRVPGPPSSAASTGAG